MDVQARFRRVLVAAATVVGLVPVVTAPVVGTASPVSAAPAEALLVGDSVMNGMAQGYGAPARAALAARHSYVLDTAGCRRLITTSCSIGSAPRPSNALTVVRGRVGQYSGTLVIGVGYNDAPNGSAGVGAAVDVLIAEARSAGIADVVWLTYREAGSASNITRFRANNAVLRSKVGQYPELRLADWNAVSAGLPSSWFSDDGVHLGGSAASAMADLIGDALDARPANPGPSTAPVDPRCADARWTGDAPTSGAPAIGGTSGALHLLDAPVRLLDTRDRPGKVGSGRVVAVPIDGVAGVVGTATAAMVSVISVEPCADGFITAFPCGSAPPVASMLNAVARDVVANAALVAVGTGGSICIMASAATDIVVDLSGVVTDVGARTTPVAPVRLVDTRPGETQLVPVTQQRVGGAGLTVDLGALFASANPDAVSINLTAVDPAADGFLSVLPGRCGEVAPSTSVLNMRAGRNAAAMTTARLVDGRFCVFANVAADVVIDLQATHGSAGAALTPVAPSRLFDSRGESRIEAGVERRLTDLLAPRVTAAAVNVTVVQPAGAGFVSLYPCASGRPTVSNVNVHPGTITANLAIVTSDGSGDVCLFSSVTTDVVIDLEAWIG